MLVNDVASHYMDPYIPSKKKNYYSGFSGLSINTIIILSSFIITAGVALLVDSFINGDGWQSKVIAILGALLVIVFGLIVIGIFYIKNFIGGKLKNGKGLDLTKNFSPTIVANMFAHFGKTPIGVIKQMLTDRFTSVITLNMDVFLKRVRQLLYQQFMDQGRTSFRLKTNHIYDLSFSNDLNRGQYDSAALRPNTDMQIIAQHAFEMGTTLWFDTGDQLADSEAAIIACGQFTTCYNLLEYISRMKNDPVYFSSLDEPYRKKVDHLFLRLKEHYGLFQKDPFWLYNQLGKECKIPGFQNCDMKKFPPPKEFKGLR